MSDGEGSKKVEFWGFMEEFRLTNCEPLFLEKMEKSPPQIASDFFHELEIYVFPGSKAKLRYVPFGVTARPDASGQWRFRVFGINQFGPKLNMETGGYSTEYPWVSKLNPYSSTVTPTYRPRLVPDTLRTFKSEVEYFWNDEVDDVDTKKLEESVDEFVKYACLGTVPELTKWLDASQDSTPLLLWMFNMHKGLGAKELTSLVLGAKLAGVHPNSKADEVAQAMLAYYTNPGNEIYIDGLRYKGGMWELENSTSPEQKEN